MAKASAAADPRQTETSIANGNWRAYQRARDLGHRDYVEDAKLFDSFYIGDQWDTRDEQQLDSEGRPHITINQVLKLVNAFIGEEKKTRADITFKPYRDATSETATTMTKLVQQIMDNNKFEYTEREVFSDGIVNDRGFFDIRMDFQKNILGEVQISADDPFEIIPDSDGKTYDTKTWNSVMKTKWMTLDEIETNYGKKNRDKVEGFDFYGGDAFVGDDFSSDAIRFEGTRTFGALGGIQAITYTQEELYQKDIRAVRIIERQYKRLDNVLFFVDPITGDMSQVPASIDEEGATIIAQKSGALLMKRVEQRIRWTVTALSLVLHDDWSPYRSFTIVPYFPYFRKGKASGLVRQLVSPQEQLNKIESQILHVINTTANSGWIFEAGSLVNITKEDLENRGAETGLVIEVRPGRERPEKIRPNEIPTGLVTAAERARISIIDIAGINPSASNSQESKTGDIKVTTLEDTTQQIQYTVPFDNLQRTRQLVGEKILELVQDFYTETRILRVTNWEDLNGPQEEIPVNAINAAGQLVNNLGVGEYDIVVSSQPSRSTFQDAQFAESLMMRQAGVMIPDDVVIRNSNLDNKFQIADRVARLTGVAEPTPEELKRAADIALIEIQQLQADVEKTKAASLELQARAQEQFSKAQTLEGEAQQEAMGLAIKYQTDLASLQAKLEMFYADLQNKLQLANIHSTVKLDTTVYKAAADTANEEFKAMAARALKTVNNPQRK